MSEGDGHYQRHPISEADCQDLVQQFLAIVNANQSPAPIVEYAAIMLYGCVAGAIRTIEDEEMKRRRFCYFWLEAGEAMTQLALRVKYMDTDELVRWEQGRMVRGSAAVS